MDDHRAKCQHEGLPGSCPGCDARLLRMDMDAHVEATHLGSAVKLLQSGWSRIAALEAELESEKRHSVGASPTSRVFNWRAGWGGGTFKSETYDFGEGGVTGKS